MASSYIQYGYYSSYLVRHCVVTDLDRLEMLGQQHVYCDTALTIGTEQCSISDNRIEPTCPSNQNVPWANILPICLRY